MNRKNAKRRGVTTKALTLILAVVMVIGISVGATLAWLTAESVEITNTFSVGDIKITLTETERTYKIVPGGESAKDPVITVTSGSEDCYVYVLVDNGLVIGNDVVGTPNIDSTEWTVVMTSGTKTLYRYIGTKAPNNVVSAASAAVELPVFTKVSYDGAKITETNIGSLNDKTIVLQGYAHQSLNVTVDNADTAAKAWAKLS